MTRRLISVLSGIVLIAAVVDIDGAQTPEQNRSAGNREAALRIHRDKDRSDRRPEWVVAAVTRGQELMAATKGDTGLEDPEAELVLDTAIEGEPGRTQLRFNQVHNGVLVFGSQIVVELDEGSGSRIAGKSDRLACLVETTPAITRQMATQLATTALAHDGPLTGEPAAELVILPADDATGKATLAWIVDLVVNDAADGTTRHRYFLRADDGDVVMHYGSSAGDMSASRRE